MIDAFSRRVMVQHEGVDPYGIRALVNVMPHFERLMSAVDLCAPPNPVAFGRRATASS